MQIGPSQFVKDACPEKAPSALLNQHLKKKVESSESSCQLSINTECYLLDSVIENC